MYTVYLDDRLIYHPNAADLSILDPILTLELNTAGSFVFTMPATHPYYDSPILMLSRVEVYRNDELIFRGRITDQTVDFWKRKKITCEGELAYLNDTIQPAAEYHDITLRGYLQKLIDVHNDQVEDDKKFVVGVVTVSDSNDSLFRYTNFNSTLEEIKEDLVDDYGGYLKVRYLNGVRYLDYVELEDYGNTNDQAIRFGTNLLDFTQDMDVTDIATVVIPLGERLEESPIPALDMRLTIEDVNDGKNWVQSDEGVAIYGRITKTVVWDDVTVAENLLEKGKQYLSDTQWDDVELTATAIDMSLTDTETDSFGLGDELRVVSDPHGLDRYFPLSQMELYLLEPQRNTYTMGITTSASLTGTLITQTDLSNQLGSLSAKTSSRTADAIANASSEILDEAKQAATDLINAATHGYVIVEPDEILIMDTNDKSTATKLWRWNLNGLGYSSTGYEGTYGTAMTMDGGIVADYITTGTMYADRIKGGTLTLGGSNNTYGAMSILNASGTEVGSWNRNGITATAGTIGGWTLSSSALYSGTSSMTSTTVGTYIGTNGIRQYASSSAYVNIQDGIVTAYGASISGTITATTLTCTNGTIGGWTIGSSALYYNTDSMTSTTNGTYISRNGIRQYNSGNYLNITSASIENGASSGSYSKLYSGTLEFYQTGTYAGSYGTGTWTSVSGTIGMFVHLEYGCDFISFGRKESSSGTTYTSAYYISYNTSISAYRHNFSGTVRFGGYVYLNSYRIYLNDSAYIGLLNSSAFGYGLYCYGPLSATDAIMAGNTSYGTNYMLHVNGSAYASGDWYNGSDESIKQDIQPLAANTESFIDKIEPISFRYKNDEKRKIHFGITSQNVRAAIEAEGIDPDDTAILSTAVDEDGTEYGAVAYDELIGPLIYEIKQLKAQIKALQNAG